MNQFHRRMHPGLLHLRILDTDWSLRYRMGLLHHEHCNWLIDQQRMKLVVVGHILECKHRPHQGDRVDQSLNDDVITADVITMMS